jgi:hypothetical protein
VESAYTVLPFDLGITAVFTRRHWWFAPWLGEHFSASTNSYGSSITTADFAMIGVNGGVDIHDGLAVFLDLEHNFGGASSAHMPDQVNPVFQSWDAMTIGVAYHY